MSPGSRTCSGNRAKDAVEVGVREAAFGVQLLADFIDPSTSLGEEENAGVTETQPGITP
jgi:hypothetical protein